MNTRHLVSACAMAMLIVVWGIAPAVLDAQTPDADEFPDAESVEPYHTSPAGSLGSSNVNVIDGWFIDCPSKPSRPLQYLRPFVGGANPGDRGVDAATGSAAVRRAPQGRICILRAGERGLRAILPLRLQDGGTTNSGANYTSFQACHTANHGFLDHMLMELPGTVAPSPTPLQRLPFSGEARSPNSLLTKLVRSSLTWVLNALGSP